MCDFSNKSTDDLVGAYVQIRDKKAEIKANAAAEMAKYDEALEMIEAEVSSRLQTSGAQSIRTSAGTAYLSTRTSVKVADKTAFMDYVRANDAFDMLDVKANKTAIEGFMEAHQDTPPGVVVSTEQTVGFRRA